MKAYTRVSRAAPVLALAAVLAAAALFGYRQPTGAEPGGSRVLLENKGGAVLFGHQQHQAAYGVDCRECHHTGLGAEDSPPACGSCHPKEFDATWNKNHPNVLAAAFSDPALCGSCHHTAYESLHFDHDRHVAEYGGDDCRQCHHGPDIWPEPEACGKCHGPTDVGNVPSLAKANHKVCGRCHDQLKASSRTKLGLAGADQCGYCHVRAQNPALLDHGLVACSTCHEQETAALVPTRTDAFHGQCMGCHESSGGPAGQECARCHISK